MQKMKTKFDIQSHILVPKHIKLKPEETQKVLEEFNISIKQLPQISNKDAMVKLLGAKPGEVIKIIRKSPTAGEFAFYRVVVSE